MGEAESDKLKLAQESTTMRNAPIAMPLFSVLLKQQLTRVFLLAEPHKEVTIDNFAHAFDTYVR